LTASGSSTFSGAATGPLSRVVAELPATVPFVAPEAIERRRGGKFELRLGANESMFGPSPLAVVAAARALRNAAWYGDPESHALRECLQGVTGALASRIRVGSGIDDLLGLAVRCTLDPGDVAVASAGTYPTFGYHVRAQGAELAEVPYREDMRCDLEALAERAAALGAAVVYLANPDNPSGTFWTGDEVRALAGNLPAGCALFLDEAYADFTEEPLDGLGEPPDRLLRFRTFSKGHGLAGLRIGYAIAAERYTAAFDKIRVQFGVNRVAQAAALAALHDPEHLEWVVSETETERRYYRELGERQGWSAIPSSTNFIAFDVGDADLAAAWVGALEQRGVFVRRGGSPPLDRCIRITVGRTQHRQALEPILAELKEGLESPGNGRRHVADRS
jgi:histidinol-phosphate aminotransferase